MKKISIANGNYTAQDGTQKTNWVKVGVIGTSANGKEYVLLDPTVNLAAFHRDEGKDMVMCTVYDDSQNNQQQTQGYPQQNYQPAQQQYAPPQQQQGYQPPPTTYEDARGQAVPPPQQHGQQQRPE